MKKIKNKSANPNITIGKNIRTLRQKKGWSQTYLAKYLNSSSAYISQIEKGKVRFSYSKIVEFADVLSVTLTILLEDENQTDTTDQVINDLKIKLNSYNTEIIHLQEKIIALYEEDSLLRV